MYVQDVNLKKLYCKRFKMSNCKDTSCKVQYINQFLVILFSLLDYTDCEFQVLVLRMDSILIILIFLDIFLYLLISFVNFSGLLVESMIIFLLERLL